jgi:hypothetical protein
MIANITKPLINGGTNQIRDTGHQTDAATPERSGLPQQQNGAGSAHSEQERSAGILPTARACAPRIMPRCYVGRFLTVDPFRAILRRLWQHWLTCLGTSAKTRRQINPRVEFQKAPRSRASCSKTLTGSAGKHARPHQRHWLANAVSPNETSPSLLTSALQFLDARKNRDLAGMLEHKKHWKALAGIDDLGEPGRFDAKQIASQHKLGISRDA